MVKVFRHQSFIKVEYFGGFESLSTDISPFKF